MQAAQRERGSADKLVVVVSDEQLLAETLAFDLERSTGCNTRVVNIGHRHLPDALDVLHPSVVLLALNESPTRHSDSPILDEHLMPAAIVRLAPEASLDDVRAAVTRALVGQTGDRLPMPAPTAPQQSEGGSKDALSPRELAILRRFADGDTTSSIAADLGIATATVRKHVQNILVKLGVHSRLEAAAVAMRRGIL